MAYPSYLTCSYSPLCRLTHFLSVTLVSYPLILTTILTCIVSIFITVTLTKLNKVNPAPGSFPFVINVSHANLTPRPTAHSEDEVDIAVEEFIATMYNQQPSQRPPTVEIPNQDKLKTLKLGITMNLLTCLFLFLLPQEVVVVQSKSCTMDNSECEIFLQNIAPMVLLSIVMTLTHPLLLLLFLWKKWTFCSD